MQFLDKARASIDATRLMVNAQLLDSAASRAYHAMFYVAEIEPRLRIGFAHIEALIAMKEAAGRARDRDDVEHLRMILDLSKPHE